MNIFIDFETYHDKDYSLKKIPTDNYVHDPRFKIHGMAIKVDDEPGEWLSDPDDIAWVLTSNDWSDETFIAHNTYFDGYILSQKFGIKPKRWLCTMCMGRGLFGPDISNNLSSVALRLGLPGKSDDVKFTEGREKLTPAQLTRLGNYSVHDLDICAQAFCRMVAVYPPSELDLIDLTLRMFLEPRLELDYPMLEAYHQEEIERKLSYLRTVEWLYPYVSSGQNSFFEVDKLAPIREHLSSDQKFEKLLKKLGIKVPYKKDGKTAFSKTDAGFKNMLKSPDLKVKQIAQARLAINSSMGETRSQSLMAVRDRPLPVQLLYFGAHSSRWSGQGKRNLQNLKKGSPLRKAIKAPMGYKMAKSDSGQIEARLTAYIATQLTGKDCLLLDWFRKNMDAYCEFGTMFYERPITKADEFDRFVSKQAVLGLGFQMSPPKFQWQMKALADIDFDMPFCEHIVTFYRETFPEIKSAWWIMTDLLDVILKKGYKDFGFWGVDQNGIRLPSGLYIHYNDLQRHETEKNGRTWTQYDYLGWEDGKRKRVNLFGGKVLENLIQGLDRQIVAEQMLVINERYNVVHNEHDGLIALVPEREAEEALEWIVGVMSTPPQWAKDFPVAAEGKLSERYGE